MRRLCFIGDSHLACIKKAWDAARADATFFALPGKGMERLEVQGGALSSDSPDIARYLKFVSGGFDRIDGTYDAYALHAMHLGMAVPLALLREMHKTAPLATRVDAPDFRAALREAIDNSIAIATLRKLRQIAGAPVVVAPTPTAHGQFKGLRERLAERDAARPLAALFAEECDIVCRSLGASFVPQPVETLDEDGLGTKAEYSSGAARFWESASQQDAAHMNARYGAIMTAAILKALL